MKQPPPQKKSQSNNGYTIQLCLLSTYMFLISILVFKNLNFTITQCAIGTELLKDFMANIVTGQQKYPTDVEIWLTPQPINNLCLI